jgi:hypothetical protein
MAQISLPETGQPIDLNYITQIASSINELTTTVNSRNSVASSINNVSKLNNNLRFFGGTFRINKTKVAAGETAEANFTYGPFDGIPVVTASIVQNGPSPLADVFLKDVTNSTARAIVVFRTNAAVNVSLNLIAIGIAPGS